MENESFLEPSCVGTAQAFEPQFGRLSSRQCGCGAVNGVENPVNPQTGMSALRYESRPGTGELAPISARGWLGLV